jgi:hypothetical protein
MPTVCSEVISRTKRRPQARRTTRKSVEAAACLNAAARYMRVSMESCEWCPHHVSVSE